MVDSEEQEAIEQLREILSSTSEEDKVFMTFLEDVGLLDSEDEELLTDCREVWEALND